MIKIYASSAFGFTEHSVDEFGTIPKDRILWIDVEKPTEEEIFWLKSAVGFADKRGPSSYNFNLSMWRAQMTASYLARKGVDIGKIRVAAYGKEIADLLGRDFKAQRAVKIFLVY